MPIIVQHVLPKREGCLKCNKKAFPYALNATYHPGQNFSPCEPASTLRLYFSIL